MYPAKVYIADTSVLEDKDLFDALYARLPAYRQKKVDTMRFAKDKRLSLGVGILLEKAFLDAGIQNPVVAFAEYGKPYLQNYPERHFSLSHSGTKVMCIIGDTEVGCDVEKLNASALYVVKRVFSPSELNLFALHPNQLDLFFRIWTLKESFSKAKGAGLSLLLSRFSLSLEGKRFFNKAEPSYSFFEFPLDDEYKYACCIKDCETAPELIKISLQDLRTL